jgi:hypothetical protein
MEDLHAHNVLFYKIYSRREHDRLDSDARRLARRSRRRASRRIG